MKNIGKPCAGKPHARFDEGGQVRTCSLLYPFLNRGFTLIEHEPEQFDRLEFAPGEETQVDYGEGLGAHGN